MTIKIGDKLPNGSFNVLTDDGMSVIDSQSFFEGKTVALLALPGAFTPTCSATHLPGFVVKFDELKDRGVDAVACLSVNDAFVMSAWQKASNAENITMLADGEALFSHALGLTIDLPGMGIRSRRYSMLVENGVIQQLNLDEPGKFDVSDVDTLLSQLEPSYS